MPADSSRKIVSLAALERYKDLYDQYMKDYVAQQIEEAAFSSGYTYKGSATVAEINALLAADKHVGDVYNVSDSGTLTSGSVIVAAGDNVAWTGTAWNKLAGVVDVSNFVTVTGNAQTIYSEKHFDGDVWINNGGLNIGNDENNYKAILNNTTNSSSNQTFVFPPTGGTIATTTHLESYLPLTASSTKPLTGTLYVKSGDAYNNASIRADGEFGSLYLYSYGDVTLDSGDGEVAIKAGSYRAKLTTVGISSSDKSFSFPNESGTLAVGEYASYTQGGDIDGLFA